MNKEQIGWKACMKGMGRFVSPYKGKLLVAVLTTVFATAIYSLNPTIEGLATTQLARDASEILQGVSGAHVHFDKVFRILALLGTSYVTRALVLLVSAFFLTNAIQQTMHDLRGALQKKIQKMPVSYFDEQSGPLRLTHSGQIHFRFSAKTGSSESAGRSSQIWSMRSYS